MAFLSRQYIGPFVILYLYCCLWKFLKSCSVDQYADDTQVYYHFCYNELSYAVRNINDDLEVISQYFKAHRLMLNEKKTNVSFWCT